MYKKRILAIIGLLVPIMFLLVGCEDDDSLSSSDMNNSQQTQQTAKVKKYKLSFFENRLNSDLETGYYEIGYYVDGKLQTLKLNSDEDNFKEVIDPKITNPYVTKNNDDDTYIIHRAPYNMYSYDKKRKLPNKDTDYQLAFVENTANSNMDKQYYTIGFYTHSGKLRTMRFNSDSTNYKEVIDPKLKAPYVNANSDENLLTFYRPPYNQFNQTLIDGKVTDKESK